MPQLKLWNTEKRAKETILPKEGKLRLYTCGPTVYNYAHIGNFRTYVFEDLLRRTLEFFGTPVRHVMNITDIDDKTIKGALEAQVSLHAYTEKYTKAFFADLKTLHILPAEVYPKATEYVDEMIKIIEKLVEKGIAYKGQEGSVYFHIRKFPGYGRLSGLSIADMGQEGFNRIDSDEYDKEQAQDFVLWKAYDKKRDGDVFWESPFGRGRPGWHIECSAMAMALLGESIDLHCGGVDNIFPHHENEIAQSECYSGQCFSRHWAHAEHLMVEGKKMSKSLGNFYSLRDILNKGYTGAQVRYLLLQTHYKTPLNFTFAGLDGAKNSLQRFSDFFDRMRSTKGEGTGNALLLVQEADRKFIHALSDDLNISAALAALFDCMRQINSLCDENKVSADEGSHILEWFMKVDSVIGALPLNCEKTAFPEHVRALFEKRNVARSQKDWAKADDCRKEIEAMGYYIEDGPESCLKKR